ncbi:pilus assembly protein TadG-related protein [Aestuariivirga sp.]|uniref:pilus assembly protein TadG-related protein n=1 Tax=Aestuariivirga sp. TaxID=2650926 RepID=UPI0039E6C9FE
MKNHTFKSLAAAARKLARRYSHDSAGNLTMILAVAALPMMVAVGAGVDYGRIARDTSAFRAATNSAALAVISSDRSSLTGLTDSQKAARMRDLTTFATTYITQNYGAADNLTVSLDITDELVTLTASHTLPNSLMGMAGLTDSTYTTTTQAKKASRPVELVMVMDTTGSMGTTYMAQAKTAAHNLMTKIYGGTLTAASESQYIRVALVPFSGAVRLNTSAYDFDWNWIDTTGKSDVASLNFTDPSTKAAANATTWNNYTAWSKMKVNGSALAWNGCVEARTGTYATSDDAPSQSTGASLFEPYFAPDEPTFSNSSNYGYYNSYIGTSTEYSGMSGTYGGTTYSSTSSSVNSNSTLMLARQNNTNKYSGTSISSESSSDYGPWFNCVKTPIVPLTYNRSKIETAIDAMTASGSTVIPEGLAWGWRVLSPTEPFTKVEAGSKNAADTIAPYHHPRWRKVMVLMTDGENDVLSNGSQVNTLNGTWYSSYGRGKAATANRFGTTTATSTGAALDANMLTLCSNIKATGIEIYTVAFRVTNTNILANLQACATDSSHYSFAADGVALGTVFNHIGDNVNSTAIYLTK